MRRIVFLSILFSIICLAGKAQCNPQSISDGSPCSLQEPAKPISFCASTNPNGVTYTSTADGPNASSFIGSSQAGCCLTTPNPAWFFFQIDASGTMTIRIEQHSASGSELDVDFVCWGPFTAISQYDFTSKLCCGAYNISDATIVDCSYSDAAVENCNLGTVQNGQYYLLLITNYSDQVGTVKFNATASSTATTNCDLSNNLLNNASSNSPLCEGGTLELYVNNPQDGATYNWTGPNGFSQSTTSTTLSIPNATTNMSGVYHMTMSGITQTSNEALVEVTIHPSPTPQISDDFQTICEGESLQLSALGNHPTYTYNWSASMPNGTYSVIANGQASIVVSPEQSTTYILTAEDENGCIGTDNINITVSSNPDIQISADNSSLCHGESANITATGGSQYSWSNGSTGSTIHVTPNNTTTYTVQVVNNDGCASTASIVITVYTGTQQSTANGSPCSQQTAANPFCTDDNPYGITYASGTGSHTAAGFFGNSSGSDIGCLGSTPRPAWYYMQIDQPGNLLIYIQQFNNSGSGIDVDFACWGPFTASSQEDFMEKLCCGQFTFTDSQLASHRPSNGDHTNNMGGYPDGTMVDCSYYGDYTEWCYIPNAQTGQWYILLLTNFNGSAGTITFSPVAASSTATTNCNLLNAVSTNSPSSNPICEGGTLELYVTNPHDGATYNWTGPNGFAQSTTSTTIQIHNATPAMSGEYQMTMTGVSQNSNVAIINVTVAANPTPEIIADHEAICIGESIHLSASSTTPDQQLIWAGKPLSSGSFAVIARDVDAIVQEPTATYRYVLTASDINTDCIGRDTVDIIVNPAPDIKVTISNPFVCHGQSSLITASGGSHYHWSTGSSNNSIQVTPNQTTSYTVEIQTDALCEGDTTVEIIVSPEISLSYEVLPSYCGAPTGEITMHATGGAGNFVYSSKHATFTENTADMLTSGSYIITASDSVGCDVRTTVTVPLEAGPTPCFFFTSTDDVNMSITNCTQGDNNNYFWDFGDGVTSSETHPMHEYMDPGRYSVSMVVVDENNCIDSLRKDYIINGPVFIANAFTPNGDGINDEIFVIGKSILPEDFLWVVYDRHGSLVFLSLNPTIGWDGTLPNGKDALPGVYVYRLKYKDVNGNHFERDGNITLVR